MELAWLEQHVIDPGELREAVSRACLAHAGTVLPLITMDYWPEHAVRFTPVWDEILRTVQIGRQVSDPLKGPVFN